MKQFDVKGMSCAACVSRVEKAVKAVEGVEECTVSLLTNSMSVKGEADTQKIISALNKVGYKAAVKGQLSESKAEEKEKDNEILLLKRRLITSFGFLAVLMYIAMGHTMFSLPLPDFLGKNPVANGITQMLLALTVMLINKSFFINGIKGILHRAPNMDTLVAMGSGASFIWSLYELYAMSSYQLQGESEAAMQCLHSFYFESAAMIVTLITVGKTLEAKSKGKTTDAIKTLMKLRPKTATVLVDGEEKELDISQVKKGDIFVVRPGESIPVDAVVLEGGGAVDEAALTGESVPVDKKAGDRVSAATVNRSGFLKCEATAVGEDTTLSQIIKMVSDAAATKAPVSKIADKVSGIFVPSVMVIGVITAIVWLIAGQNIGYAVARGVSVLVISCPCALGLATPVAIMVGNGVGAKNGILFKTAASLEMAGKTDIVVLDKTGTVTKGEPEVTDIIVCGGTDEKELVSLAASLESKSEHPLAKAILSYSGEKNVSISETEDFITVTGRGLEGRIGKDIIRGGNKEYIGSFADISEEIIGISEKLAQQGKSPLFFCRNNSLIGVIAVADVIKKDSPEAIKELKKMGIEVVMLTGDNRHTAEEIGRQAGVDRVVAQVLPDGKEAVIRELQQKGRVTMVGDGINDAPALTRADSGVAIGAGTDIAIDAADIVLMKSRLSDVPAMIRLSRKTLKNIHQNLFWAFFYNSLGIPLAAGVFIPLLGWGLNPMFGAAAMSLSSFCVVSNALRLNFADIRCTKNDRKKKKGKITIVEKVENLKDGEIAIKIEGMMCSHCEKTVKEILEKFDFIEYALPDHEKAQAVVKLCSEADFGKVKASLESEGYKLKLI